jgi:heterodisulfide reductase subunit A-like polyferredoxin
MKLSELVSHQRNWESERGIKNGNDGINRIQMELDEAREAETPEQRIWELIDVFIISAGGIAGIAEKLNIGDEQIDEMIVYKLGMNSRKYPVENFQQGWSTEEAIAYSRCVWAYLRGDLEE